MEITKIIETNLTIEFKNLPQREMEIFKDCFAQIINIKNKIVYPGQIIIHFDNLGNVMQIETKGIAWKRKKLDKVY